MSATPSMGECELREHSLVTRLRLGNHDALRLLVGRYTPRLLWFVRRLGLAESAAVDVVQEAWLVAWSSLHQLRTPERFRPWLYGIARNKALQQLGVPRQAPLDGVD